MAFTPRTRAQIRDSLLSFWQARHRADGRDLLIARGSDAYKQAEAIALILEAVEAQAGQLRNEILVSTASEPYLLRHGGDDGVTRRAASAAVVNWTVTGTASSTVTFGTSVLQIGTLKFKPNSASVVLDSSGNGTVATTCQTAGVAGNVSSGVVGQWSSTPANANPTATVASLATSGLAEESPADYAARILGRRRERPASGNRADWQAWALQCDGVSEAYVYPLYHATAATVDKLGCVTTMCLGPKPGDRPAHSGNDWGGRILTSARLDQVKGYIDGTHNAAGTAITGGTQLRPATMRSGNMFVVTATANALNVKVVPTVSSAYAFNIQQKYTCQPASSTHNSLLLGSAGDTALVGKPLSIFVGVGAKRGGFITATPTSYSMSGSVMRLHFADNTFDPSYLPANDFEGYCVYGQPANWNDIRLAVIDYFDNLGPGDVGGASARFPDADAGAKYLHKRNALLTKIMGVTGVTDVPTLTPADDSVAVLGRLHTLGQLIIAYS